MEIFNQEFIQEIIRLTWRNPAFMAIAIVSLAYPTIIYQKNNGKKI